MNLPHKPKKSLFDSISNSQCQRHSISLPEDFHLVNVTEIYPQKRPWSAGWSVLLSLLASVNAWKLHLKLRGTQNTHNNDTEVVSWFCSIQIIKKKETFQEVIMAHSPFFHHLKDPVIAEFVVLLKRVAAICE